MKAIGQVMMGVMFWIVLVLGFLLMANKVFAADIPDDQNPYRKIVLEATPEEQEMLEQVLYLESGIDTFESKIATVQVILNRVLDPRFPDTIEGVLSQKGQYSTYKRRHKAQPGEDECDAIEWIVDGGPWVIGLDYIYQDNKPHGKDVVQIGKQYYGR